MMNKAKLYLIDKNQIMLKTVTVFLHKKRNINQNKSRYSRKQLGVFQSSQESPNLGIAKIN